MDDSQTESMEVDPPEINAQDKVDSVGKDVNMSNKAGESDDAYGEGKSNSVNNLEPGLQEANGDGDNPEKADEHGQGSEKEVNHQLAKDVSDERALPDDENEKERNDMTKSPSSSNVEPSSTEREKEGSGKDQSDGVSNEVNNDDEHKNDSEDHRKDDGLAQEKSGEGAKMDCEESQQSGNDKSGDDTTLDGEKSQQSGNDKSGDDATLDGEKSQQSGKDKSGDDATLGSEKSGNDKSGDDATLDGEKSRQSVNDKSGDDATLDGEKAQESGNDKSGDDAAMECEESQASGGKGDASADSTVPDKGSAEGDEPLSSEEKEEEGGTKRKEVKDKDKDEGSDIEEIPVHREPAELVDLEEEDKTEPKEPEEEKDDKREDSGSDSNAKGLKLRSLASLVDTSENDAASDKSESQPLKSGPVVPNPEAFGAIGEIVEHKDMFFDPDAGGLPLRISNVVGGEDCITGLAMDEDRDVLSSIQIYSVTTLIDPISPEDPNKEKNDDHAADQDVDMDKAENATLESSEESGIKIVCAESLASKDDDTDKAEESGPKIRLSSAVSEVAKDDSGQSDQSVVYHILRSILTMPRECMQCTKKVKCDFRLTKKGQQGTISFICSADCRNSFTNNLQANETVEKPRLIFEKLCGMCHKDLTTQPRSGQFSWETREFCSENCLVTHLEEVAGKCHMCTHAVRPVYIGKYCVRFGSDIHQFCSNYCLERYKTKIKVCCYCQKNVETIAKVTSPANKEYCSLKCLKRAQRRDIGQQNYNETHPCTVCQAQGTNRYEFLMNGEAQQLCSDPCLNVFKYVNKVKAVTCCLCYRVMNAEDVSQYLYHGGHQLRVFCSDACVNVFVLSARKIVVCDCCKVKKYNFDMIHRQVDEEFREFYYCSLHCLKIRDVGTGAEKTSTTPTTSATSSSVPSGNISTTTASTSEAPIAVCSMCNSVAKAQFHMVMSDSTLRSFCRYSCASRYKNTFGFLVENGQAKDAAPAKSAPVPSIRPKPTSQLTTSSGTSTNTTTKSVATGISQETLQATTELLKMLVPPAVENKTTMCKPSMCTKGVYCKPHPWHRQTQTELSGVDTNLSDKDFPPILPVPIPCYVPSPMCMYNVPCPVPIFVPIPLPVPIFLPTSAKTSKDVVALMKKVEDEIPTDPIQAEMLLLARQSMEENREENHSEGEDADQAEQPSPVDNFTSYSGDDEAGNDEAINEEVNSADEACLNTMEDDLPRYPLRDNEIAANYTDSEPLPEPKGKRKKRGRGRPRKRMRRDSDDDSQSFSDFEDMDDPEFFPEPETVLEEEFQGPFLNKMYGLTAWKSWVTKKNAELAGVSSSRSMKLISEDLLTMNCDELNYALCLFLKDLRKPNGDIYQPDTILYLLLGE